MILTVVQLDQRLLGSLYVHRQVQVYQNNYVNIFYGHLNSHPHFENPIVWRKFLSSGIKPVH